MTTNKYALSHSERGWLLHSVACIRRGFIQCLKNCCVGKETLKWIDLLSLKLIYGLVFFGVVEWIYVWWADKTLLEMPEPLIRTEQFMLSVLIHYPQYLLMGIIGGLSVVLILNLLINAWMSLALCLLSRMSKSEHLSNSVKEEMPHV